MENLCLFVINVVLLLPVVVAGETATALKPIKTHVTFSGLSLLEHGVAADNGKSNDKQKTESGVKSNEPLNLIFSPTVQQVSDENNKLLESVESGLHSLRTAFDRLTRLIHLLPEEEKQATFTVDKQSYTIADMLDSVNHLIVEGEKQQRIMIEGTAEILHKLAVPNNTSQNTPAA
ncbi:uncharacterized protein BcabD6B2_24430 [Babesia caballi]|uniref:Membrane protein, putative n=1 Tax=Babesia caballi TaxID=5871 RepID=A0AAV4LSP3_BABCB|nr:membrane protein, putative [Babesia caballi]